MSAIIQRQASNHHVQLVAAAVIGGAVVATTILGFQALRRHERIDELKRSIPSLEEEEAADAKDPHAQRHNSVRVTCHGASMSHEHRADVDFSCK